MQIPAWISTIPVPAMIPTFIRASLSDSDPIQLRNQVNKGVSVDFLKYFLHRQNLTLLLQR